MSTKRKQSRPAKAAAAKTATAKRVNGVATNAAPSNEARPFMHALNDWFGCLAHDIAHLSGKAITFVIAVLLILVWAVTGPLFHFSDTWQLIINTSTTIVTFLMVFLIQRAQNKDSLALQLKLNEVIAALRGASNRLIDIESLSEQEVFLLQERFRQLAESTQKTADLCSSHTVEEHLESNPLLNGEKQAPR